MKSKCLHRGLTLAVRAQAGAPVCLGSVRTVSTDDQPWISVVLHQQWHLPGISNAMSCTCCALCPDVRAVFYLTKSQLSAELSVIHYL